MAVKIKKSGEEAAVDQEATQVAKALGVVSASVTPVRKAPMSKQEKALVSNALSDDDVFRGLYIGEGDSEESQIIQPPYDPFLLYHLVQHNNALNQCISAYEVNIDGTGYVIESDSDEKESEEEAKTEEAIKQFFDEVYPGVSFVTLRRKVRRDLEATGNAYIEVLRSVNGDIVFMKHVDAKYMRLLKLDDSVEVEKKVTRFGKEQTVKMRVRERRFVQKAGERLVYFREFQSSRQLDRTNGKWESEEYVVDPDKRATEIIHLTVDKDVKTPYGVPRWINQIPSVLGSRKAEELNLDFFNAGGLPPALLIVQGGQMAAEVKKSLQSYLSGKGASKNRAAIIETYSTSGDLNSAGNVRVTVERFGAERQQDSMFEKYDDKSEKRVRSAFRLPPLFVGRTEDYSFATAFASYSVAEAQVFAPERGEFDEIMNVTIMREIGKGYLFRSLPLNVKDAVNQLKGIEIVANKGAIDPAELVETVNEVVNLNMKVVEQQSGMGQGLPPTEQATGEGGSVIEGGAAEPTPVEPPLPTQKVQKYDPIVLVDLANDFAALAVGEKEFDSVSKSAIRKMVSDLSPEDRKLFDAMVAMKVYQDAFDFDTEGATELCSHAAELLDGS